MKRKHVIQTGLLVSALLTGLSNARDPAPTRARNAPEIPLSRQRQPREPAASSTDAQEPETAEFPAEFRTIDGSDNHFAERLLGTPDSLLLRHFPADYADGAGEPAGADRPSARAVSNAVASYSNYMENQRGATDYLWQWGQFIDHDIDETPTLDPAEAFDILVPTGDAWFDPSGSGNATIPLNRSYYELIDGERQQVNAITSYIDASNVYGSDQTRAYALRRLDGSGMLKSTDSDHGDLLPYNEGGFANAPSESGDWFLAGDVRANEQAALTAMHTLFMREHNFWALEFRNSNPSAAEDEIYEFARMIVGAEMQHITYNEYLPLLLGADAIPAYQGFRDDVDPSIANEFATGAYRFGHSLLSPVIRRINEDGTTADEGNLPLAEAFFDPSIIEESGIASILRGLASQPCQELDGVLVDAVRNFLFGPPGSGGFDLASLNIQRGRDHGLPSYNEVRSSLGMPPANDFRDISLDPEVQQQLASVYASVDDVDLWCGGLCEPHLQGAMVGPVFHRIILDQFLRLRDGDRFFYEQSMPPELLRIVQEQTLASVIRRNTEIGDELPDEVFTMPGASVPSPVQTAPSNSRRDRGPARSRTRQ